MTWSEFVLGDAVKVEHGFAFKSEFFRPEGRLLVVTPGNFLEPGGFRVRPGKERYYAGDFPERYLLEKDDLVIAMTEQGEGLLGSAARIPADDGFLHNQRIGLVKFINPTLLEKRFTYWLFNSHSVRAQIRSSASGTKVRHTAPERVHKVRVRVPLVESQSQIAALLDAYDDLIENNRRRIVLLEESARLLYREWFVHLRFPGHEARDKTCVFPFGWNMRSLSDVATVNRASLTSKDKPETVRYIDIASVQEGVISPLEPLDFADAPGRARRLVQHGDVIWSCVRPNRRSFALLWEPDPTVVVSTGFAVLTAISVPFSYLYFATTSDEFVAYLTNRATGAAYPAVSGNDFQEAPLVIPDPDTLSAFHERCMPLLEMRNKLLTQSERLTEARDALLPKLMSGEIAV